MSNDEGSMYCEPVSDEEAERRRGMIAEFYASNTLPPLYRLSTMAEHVDWGTAITGAPTTTTQSRFIFEADTPPGHRFEVHTVEFGTVEELLFVAWSTNFAGLPPETPTPPATVPVTIASESYPGQVLATTPDGWAVSVPAPERTFLIVGPRALPSSLSLVQAVVGTPAM